MIIAKLKEILKNEPAYRYQQVVEAIFCNLVSSWDQVSNLPRALKTKLKLEYPIDLPTQLFTSKDKKTVKALITLVDGLQIECVLMQHNDDRNTVCVSAQVGCPLGCLFCATGSMGFKRNLSPEEIFLQVLIFARYLKAREERVTNVVIMGMGEPFLNYNNVLTAVRILNDHEGFNLGARHISISTAGIIDGIKKLAAEDLQVNLAISLHAPNDKLRSQLMPINKKYSLAKVLSAVDDYIRKTNRKVMFEYLLIAGVNDSEREARELAENFKRPLYLINLVVYNPTGRFKPSDRARIEKFKEILETAGVPVTQRFSFGVDIEAACGQLIIKSNR